MKSKSGVLVWLEFKIIKSKIRMAKRVAVIILNWNGENLLREFLPSVVKNTNA